MNEYHIDEKTHSDTKKIKSKQPHVLLVDDDHLSLVSTSKILEQLSCKVTAVSTGDEAISMMSEREYDLVLMDWHMPNKNGFETTKVIRKNEQREESTPIIAHTSDEWENISESCQEAGITGYIHKGSSSQELDSLITFMKVGNLH